MIHLNMHIFCEAKNVSLRVSAVHYRRSLAAVSDMTWALKNDNARKPKKIKFDELEQLIASNGYEVGVYQQPVEMGYTDARLIAAYFGLSGHLFRFHPARRFGVIRPA